MRPQYGLCSIVKSLEEVSWTNSYGFVKKTASMYVKETSYLGHVFDVTNNVRPFAWSWRENRREATRENKSQGIGRNSSCKSIISIVMKIKDEDLLREVELQETELTR